LLQHFKGWKIKTPTPHFEPQAMTLMDFRTPQDDATRFFYVLPFSPSEALVEFTAFSAHPYQDAVYHDALQTYIKEQLNISSYEITAIEQGRIPMTTAAFSAQQSARIWNIGTRAGWIKPSTGYGFLRIWERTRALANVVTSNVSKQMHWKHKFGQGRFAFYDKLLLHILSKPSQKPMGQHIFSNMFARNDAQQVLTFLSERTHLLQEINLFARLPKRPFLKALLETSLSSILGHTPTAPLKQKDSLSCLQKT
ncbi:MAG: lycopene cyclase family protein, partial [Bacteroidota bacterium]